MALQSFNADTRTKEELLDFIHEFIARKALERMYRKEDVSHIADAKDLIDGAFEELSNIYEPKPKTKEPTNDSR